MSENLQSTGECLGTPQIAAIPSSTRLLAAREVYNVAELRQAILALLDKADLARFMRVERGMMVDVARELYYEMSLERVLLDMSRDTPRLAMYCDAVVMIDAHLDRLMPERLATMLTTMCSSLEGPRFQPKSRPDMLLQTYSPEIHDVIVCPLLAQCHNIRTIHFGSTHAVVKEPSWTVTFLPPLLPSSPARGALPTSGENPSSYSAYIDVYDNYELTLTDGPPDTLDIESAPSADILVRPHLLFAFDTHPFDPPLTSSDLTNRWMQAIQTSPIFDCMHRSVFFNNFEVTLDLVAALYERQIALGIDITSRLESVTTYNAPPWPLDAFQRFAKIASASLVKLHLATHNLEEVLPGDALVTFADLPVLVSTVRRDLPNLAELHISLGGIEEAEAVCAGMLRPDSLDEGGTVTDLLIVTTKSQTPLWNVLRAVSCLCAPRASVSINEYLIYLGETGGVIGWEQDDQECFLEYLREQSPERKAHLSTVDFTSLGLSYPDQCLQLQYDAHGRPLPMAVESSGSEDYDWDDDMEWDAGA